MTEAKSPYWRPIKYSLFPPLGLATLAAFCHEDDDVTIVDEHVERLSLDDEPDLVVIQAYITNAFRSYAIADHYRSRGVHVCLGGLHVTSLPDEASAHADTVFLGPGDHTFAQFLPNIWEASRHHATLKHRTKHLAYAAGWKRFEWLWNFLIKTGTVGVMRSALEGVLAAVRRNGTNEPVHASLNDLVELTVNRKLDA